MARLKEWKGLSILVALALVLSLGIVAVPAIPVSAATPIYVNAGTGNDAWDGQAAAWDGTHGPKQTIQAGIDVVDASGIVNVAAGTYNENVNVNKSVDLTANGTVDVTSAAATGDHVFEVTADDVNITGFDISGAEGTIDHGLRFGYAGIFYNSVTGGKAEGNNLHDNRVNIFLNSCNTVTAKDNEALGPISHYGNIRLKNSHYCTIEGNTVADTQYGIYLEEGTSGETDACTYNTITGNTLSRAGAEYSQGYGIYLKKYCNHNTVDNNSITGWRECDLDPEGDLGAGLYIRTADGSTITNNTVSDCGWGIKL